MSDVLNYRQYAADCLRQAQAEGTADGETIMLNVALAWLRLAQQTEELETESAEADTIDADFMMIVGSGANVVLEGEILARA